VLDNSAAESLLADVGATWSGYWVGTRPVEWVYGMVAGKERIFYVSKDYDGQNRLWEAFTDDREDGGGCPITWAFATRGYFGLTAGLNYPPGRDKVFCYADLAIAEARGNVDIAAFVAGGTRGQFRKVLEKRIIANRGSLRYDEVLGTDSVLYALKPQSRIVRTEDVREKPENTLSSCPVERDILENTDDCFQLLVVGMGHAGVRWIRAFAQSANEDLSGRCEANETEYNAVRFDGASSKDEHWSDVNAALSVAADYFPSTQVVTLEQRGFQAIGTGTTSSVISQAAADRAAEKIAITVAEKGLRDAIPKLVSDGDVDV
jgi:hypothetical protein